MKIRLLLFLSLSIFSLMSFAQDSIISIIPQPEFIKVNSGKFILNSKTKICVNSKDKGFLEAAEFFKSIVKKGTLMNLQIVENSKIRNEPNTIYLNNNNQSAAMSDEGYVLNVNQKNIEISSITSTGIFYGLQSLRQMLPPEIEGNGNFDESVIWEIPCTQIIDKPRFGWRGMLLDCCRHFMDKDFVLRYLDLLAYYKMNRFHWHLTEDQGWRIEIKKYPKLTEIGAWRKEEDGSTYGGFYTQADIKEVVAYAEKLHITVIPEIEMPGHAVAALAAYPHFSCTQQPITVENNWGVFKDIYCAGNDSTFKFIEDVLTEVISLFPGPYIHIGGDEAPKYRWENCLKCQNRMKVEGLKNEGELQSYFVTRIEKFLSTKNKKLIGWDEILEGGLAPNATVQSWQGVNGAISAVNSGHDAIVSPTSHAYFDYPLKSIDLKKVYKFDPVPDGILKENVHHILGGECNMWTEHAPQEKIDSKMFPRILAMSEVLWSPLEGKDYYAFNKRVQKNYSKLDYLGVKYGFETQPISFDVKFDEVEKAFKVALISGQKGLKMNYTTDGYKPTKSSTNYENTLVINHSCELQASIFQGSQTEAEVFSRQLVLHKGINKKYKLTFHYHQNYSATGDNSLLDGQKGSTDFHDGLWQGFQKNDFEAVIDMGEITKITKISASFLQSMPSWIFFPEDVEYLVSDDGINFKTVAAIKNDALQNLQETKLKEFDSNFENLQTRYIKVKAKKVGVCPDWHEAAGSEAWLFIDEIVID
ncbi:MAG: family 20 glycosylhydrolase [Bacteroidetes bacterium]|nr:family 20 glycosylhydrolase [Bacteroidota bacterium]